MEGISIFSLRGRQRLFQAPLVFVYSGGLRLAVQEQDASQVQPPACVEGNAPIPHNQCRCCCFCIYVNSTGLSTVMTRLTVSVRNHSNPCALGFRLGDPAAFQVV